MNKGGMDKIIVCGVGSSARVWCQSRGRFLAGQEFEYRDGSLWYCDYDDTVHEPGAGVPVVELSTGVVDHRGRLIFEGDVVRSLLTGEETVVDRDTVLQASALEVVGNIHGF